MDDAAGTPDASAETETPAPAADAPAVPEGAVASVKMPIETVIPPVAGEKPAAAHAKAATTPVAAAAEATMRFLRSLAHQPRPASQHKD